MVSEIDRARAAGLFDGEGTVRITTRRARQLGTLEISVPSTDLDIVEWLAERWPVRKLKVVHANPGANRRMAWRWIRAAGPAVEFLHDVKPYVISQRMHDRIDLALEFQQQKSLSSIKRGDPTIYEGVQFGYYLRMAELNVRGVR